MDIRLETELLKTGSQPDVWIWYVSSENKPHAVLTRRPSRISRVLTFLREPDTEQSFPAISFRGNPSQNPSHLTTNGQSHNLSRCQATIWGSSQIFLLSFFFLLEIIFRQLQICYYGAPSLTEDESVIYRCCWASLAQFFSGLSSVGLMTNFYFLKFEISPIWRAGFPYLFRPKVEVEV
jgi:hypothetical protein